jgi:hypothetical protein
MLLVLKGNSGDVQIPLKKGANDYVENSNSMMLYLPVFPKDFEDHFVE